MRYGSADARCWEGLLFGIGYALMRIFLLREKLRAASKVDPVTGLYNRTGFIDRLDGWIGSGTEAFGVFLFMISDCQRISRTVDNTQTMAFLRGVPGLFAKYIKNDYLAGVMGDGCFVVAVREGMTAEQMSDLAQGLSLQLLWKVNLNGTKVFLEAQYDYLVYPQGGKTAEELLRNLFSQFYERLQSESPLRSLSEKCRSAGRRTDGRHLQRFVQSGHHAALHGPQPVPQPCGAARLL